MFVFVFVPDCRRHIILSFTDGGEVSSLVTSLSKTLTAVLVLRLHKSFTLGLLPLLYTPDVPL